MQSDKKKTIHHIQTHPKVHGEEATEIFDRKKSRTILLTDILIDGKKSEILIDEMGTISRIADPNDNSFSHNADIIIEGNGAIALPGLVNTHTHAAMTLLRGYADDMILQDWLSQKIWPLEAHLTGNDVYWGTKLACLEMIKNGTTAFNDMYFMMDEAARAVDESGIRAVLCNGFLDHFNAEKREIECKTTEKLASQIRSMNNPRIKAAVGPHAIYTVSTEGLKWCAEFAKEQKIGIHIHLSETEKEVSDCIAQNGKPPAVLLDECGILTQKTVAAHCCWLDEAECTLFGKRGTSAAHNPVSNMKLAVNRAIPYHWLKAAGAPVTLGTDGCASNNNLDMFEEMKVAALLQKYFWNNPTQLPAHEALTMATEAGARALGFNAGKIAVGYDADIILIDPSVVQNVPVHNQISNIVYSLNGSVVNTVIVQGKVLMFNRVVPGEEEIIQKAGMAAHALVKRLQDEEEAKRRKLFSAK